MQICPTECCTSRVKLKFHPNIHNFSSNFKVPSTPQVVGPERLLAVLFGTFGKSVSAARWPQPSLTKTQNCRRLSPAVSASNKQQLEKTEQLKFYLFVLLQYYLLLPDRWSHRTLTFGYIFFSSLS